jgi:bifunctional isochorismate lyase / aryl carrier protein
MTEKPEYLSEGWIRGWEARRNHNERLSFKPESAALLLIDLQNYFIHPEGKAFLPASKRIMPKLLDLAASWRGRRLPLVLTRHVDDAVRHPLMQAWWDGGLSAEDPDSRLIAELDPFLDEAVLVQKFAYDPFRKTGLAQILRGRGVTQVVIGGVMAHLCCETAARAAFAHDFLPFFLLDGTASHEAENHEATLVNLNHGFAVPSTCAEIKQKL